MSDVELAYSARTADPSAPLVSPSQLTAAMATQIARADGSTVEAGLSKIETTSFEYEARLDRPVAMMIISANGFITGVVELVADDESATYFYEARLDSVSALDVSSNGYIVAVQSQKAAKAYSFEARLENVAALDVSANGLILAAQQKAGTDPSADLTALQQRVSRSLTARGNSIGPYRRAWAIPRWHRSIRARLKGDVSRSILAAIGDSYSTAALYWARSVREDIAAHNGAGLGAIGDGGLGWCGFGNPGGQIGINGNTRGQGAGLPGVLMTATGSWASHYGSAQSPDICDAYSSTIGDRQSIGNNDTTVPALSGANLHYKTGQSGIVRYRWNGGVWTTLALNGPGIAALTGFPTTGGAFTFDVEVDPTNTGICTLYGVNMISSVSGFVLHKLGATGRKMSEIASISATAEWRAGFASLAPTIMTLGTPINDRNGGQSPAQYAASCATIITNARAAVPNIEVVLFIPAEIVGTYVYAMADYAAAIEPLLDTFDGVAMINFQPLVPAVPPEGTVKATYGQGSSFPYLNVDDTHPDFPFGTRVLEDGFATLLLSPPA
nr:hypothetical protein [uncultured organism]